MKFLLAIVLFQAIAWPQTCSQQPTPALSDISEWSCKRMDYDQAWDLLTANGIAPVRNAKVTQLGSTANYRSRKQRVIRGLQILGFATSLAGGLLANNDKLLDWQIGALIAGPKLTEEGVKFFGGAPNEFQETPAEAGFVTIYSRYTPKLIAGAVDPVGALFEPADQVATGQQAIAKINQWLAEVLGKPEAIPEELQGVVSNMRNPRSEAEMRWIVAYYRDRQNEAEAEAALARGYQQELRISQIQEAQEAR